MVHGIEEMLSEASMACFDSEDATLSSGEHTQAKIVTVFLEEWAHLMGSDSVYISALASEDTEESAEQLRQWAKKVNHIDRRREPAERLHSRRYL